MQEIEEIKIKELIFFKGKINNNIIILVEAGIGKVNAARVTQLMIDKFEIERIINVGSAGSANNELKIGDIVKIGESLAFVHVNDEGKAQGAIENVKNAFQISEKKAIKPKMVLGSIE